MNNCKPILVIWKSQAVMEREVTRDQKKDTMMNHLIKYFKLEKVERTSQVENLGNLMLLTKVDRLKETRRKRSPDKRYIPRSYRRRERSDMIQMAKHTERKDSSR